MRRTGTAAVAARTTREQKQGHRLRSQALEKIRIAANEYCLLNYAIAYTGGTPRRLALGRADLWIVPVVFTSPGYGVVGEVGVLAIDQTATVVGATPRREVLAAGTRLAKEKRDDLDAAFHRARTAR